MNNLILSEIWIYPVKSLGGIRLEKARAYGKGLQYDRRWMLIDQDGIAMTQRVYPEMALFKTGISDGVLSLTFIKGEEVISSNGFDLSHPSAENGTIAKVWDDQVTVMEVDPDVSKWFSHHLKTTCKLVGFPEENPRTVDPKYSLNDENVSLADAYPFLLTGQSSLDDLNKRLGQPVPMNRFRPNFVFAGGEPFQEDQWRNLSIGTIPFVAVKKSDRCVLTTVNQDTAEKGAEPLRTLSTYRKTDNKVYFGQNLIAQKEGEVSVGDRVIPG